VIRTCSDEACLSFDCSTCIAGNAEICACGHPRRDHQVKLPAPCRNGAGDPPEPKPGECFLRAVDEWQRTGCQCLAFSPALEWRTDEIRLGMSIYWVASWREDVPEGGAVRPGFRWSGGRGEVGGWTAGGRHFALREAREAYAAREALQRVADRKAVAELTGDREVKP